MSQLILQPFHHFTYFTAHSPTLPLLHLHHSSFSNPSFASSAHSPTFPSLYLCHSSFYKPSITLPMSQLILKPFHCFTYITAHSPTLLLLLLRHKLFTYVIWRATHETVIIKEHGPTLQKNTGNARQCRAVSLFCSDVSRMQEWKQHGGHCHTCEICSVSGSLL